MATCAFLLLLTSGLRAQTNVGSASDQPQAHRFASTFQPYVESNTLAGAVFLVATPNKIIDKEAVGYADLEAKKVLSSDNEFWIASMTKPMTATALMMLVEAQKVETG